MGKMILIAGYYGFGNVGDEAILAALVRELRRAFPRTPLCVLSHDPVETSRSLAVRAVNRWNPLAVALAIRSASVVILGGGGLLQDVTSRRSLYYYLALTAFAHALRKPVFLVAQGIGPLRRPRSARWVASLVRRCRFVTLRDRDSWNWLVAQGVQPTALRFGADLALLTPPRKNGSPARRESAQRYIGVVLREGLSPTAEELLIQALDRLTRSCRARAIFFPFLAVQDRAICERVAARLQPAGVVVNPSSATPSDVLGSFGELSLVISMRLHALAFAALQGVPFHAIGGDPKLESFVHRIEDSTGMSFPVWKPSANDQIVYDVDRLHKELTHLLAQSESHRESIARAAIEIRREASRGLDEVMGQLRECLGGE